VNHLDGPCSRLRFRLDSLISSSKAFPPTVMIASPRMTCRGLRGDGHPVEIN
jgi:hypothetical protein